MAARVYTTKGLPPPPDVSLTTRPIAGLLVDVYGLAEIPPHAPITCLWLMHPRGASRDSMNDFARRAVHAWTTSPTSPSRGLVALAFDMPNHGSRLVRPEANTTWADGNDLHALDMAAMVKGGVKDLGGAMDLVAGYLGVAVDAHVCLGWSMGGHAAWQAFFNEPRIDAAVVVVGCPDFMGLMDERARESKLAGEAAFLGSKYFPPDLVASCLAHDPKGITFGTREVVPPSGPEERARLRGILDARVRGKRLLLCSGGADQLVPYAASQPFVGFLRAACADGGWYADGGVAVTDKLYEGIGHKFSADMVTDALAFVVASVSEGPRRERARM